MEERFVYVGGGAIFSTLCVNPEEHSWFTQVNRKEPRILLIQRGSTAPTFPEYWSFPAGICEESETYEQTAEREVLEEVGIQFRAEKCVCAIKWKDRSMQYFTGRWKAPERIILQAEEVAGYGWFSLTDALKLKLAFRYRAVIESLIRLHPTRLY